MEIPNSAIARGLDELRQTRSKARGLFFSANVFSVLVNILMLTGPIFMLQIYDRVLTSRSEETLVALTILVVCLYVLMALLDYARGRVMARIGGRLQRDLDDRVFTAAVRRSALPHDDLPTKNSLRDLDSVQSFLSSQGFLAMLDLPWTPIFLAAIFIFHPSLGWLAVFGGLFLISLTVANQVLTSKKTRKAQLSSEEAHNFADEMRRGHEIVQSQGMLGEVLTRWTKKRANALSESLAANDWTGSFSSFTKASRLFLQSAMLALGAFLVLDGQITGGAMVAASIILGRALAPVEQLMGQWSNLQRARAGWRALGALLAFTPEIEQRTKIPEPKAELKAQALTVNPPGSKTSTLRGVTIELNPGQALAVLGRSGSGKSTMAKALMGLWAPTAGEIRLSGATLDQYGSEDFGRYVGYLPQDVVLFAGTIAENIARMSSEPDPKAVVKAARLANAHDLILSLPNGYDTVIDGSGSELSGGQKQRIALARALYGDPVLLVLDEPNSALDAEGSDALNESVRLFKSEGKAVVIMTHRPNAIAECDQVLILEGGQPTAYGPRDDVIKARIRNAQELKKRKEKAEVA